MTPLPIDDRRGDLADPDEVARIKRDAAELYRRYLVARREGPPITDERSFRVLVDAWLDAARPAVRPRTYKGYAWLGADIAAVADTARPKLDPVTLTPHDVEAMLRGWADRPTQQWHIRKALRLVMSQAVKKRWRLDNPVHETRLKMPKSSVAIWEPTDVEMHVWASVEAGQPWLAAMILTEWEIGQRPTDCIAFTRAPKWDAEGYHVAEGVFRFRQSKTGRYVTIPVSDRLRAILGDCRVEGSPYLFHDGATLRPFPDVGRLSHVFEEVRARVLKAGGRRLVFRALRHSCVVQLARASCEVPEIASITGHSIASVAKMLSVYLPRDSEVARNAQRKRGLIGGEG